MHNSSDETMIRDSLRAARGAAFEVHGALLELVRRDYERDFGRVQDAMTLLKLATSEPAFAWLRPLTAAIADADAVLVEKHEHDVRHARVLLASITELLRADEGGSDFQRRYHAAIQASPDVAVTHCRAVQGMRNAMVRWT
ncbi:MAG TPA: hypothetical protein PLL69_03220 [Gemmatimonadales bacterium]|nr:hypothetical protein [Gemmatimonadales bacterium]